MNLTEVLLQDSCKSPDYQRLVRQKRKVMQVKSNYLMLLDGKFRKKHTLLSGLAARTYDTLTFLAALGAVDLFQTQKPALSAMVLEDQHRALPRVKLPKR